MNRYAVMAAVLLAGLFSVAAQSDVPDAERHEVLHLLEFLRSSDCAMERNGKRHNSKDAYSHVKRKYDYLRDKIGTPEDFIEYSASKSTMSGEFYLIFCDNEAAMRTRDWLLEELSNYRGRNDG